MDQELSRGLVGKCLAKLLHHPRRGRMLGNVEMQGFAAAMGDQEPDEEHLEADYRDDEKVHRRDRVAMISQERGPSLALVIAAPSFREETRDSCEADGEPQFLELGMDPSGAPRVVVGEAVYEFAKLWRDGRASGSLL